MLRSSIDQSLNGSLPRTHSENSFHYWYEMRTIERQERDSITLFRKPIVTLMYFFRELSMWCLFYLKELRLYWKRALLSLLLLSSLAFIYQVPGPHSKYTAYMEKKALWCIYWIGLGVLSSVGLGTGLHTFLLYLGPHIAAVTLASFECMSVKFLEPPYPDEIICPENAEASMSISTIWNKVWLEAFMWGFGTAMGELPPYFMALAAVRSNEDPDNEEYDEYTRLLHEKEAKHESTESIMQRMKIFVHTFVRKVGFFGILLCASIPNPLFDLAGITCGHFQIPFMTFFGATFIGKAVFKVNIQTFFVIFVFSEKHLESIISLLQNVPYFGSSLQEPFRDFIFKQKKKWHRNPGSSPGGALPLPAESSWIPFIFEKLVLLLVLYFLLSIINSIAQSYHKRLWKEDPEKSYLNAKLERTKTDFDQQGRPISSASSSSSWWGGMGLRGSAGGSTSSNTIVATPRPPLHSSKLK